MKGKSSPIQIAGDKARRTSQGGAGRKYAELESELQAKQNEVEKLKKDLKIRRESEEQMKQVCRLIIYLELAGNIIPGIEGI